MGKEKSRKCVSGCSSMVPIHQKSMNILSCDSFDVEEESIDQSWRNGPCGKCARLHHK